MNKLLLIFLFGWLLATHGSYAQKEETLLIAKDSVKTAKQNHPEVELTLLLPYHPADRPIPVPDGFDSTYYPPGMESVPRKVAIVRANRYVVDHTDFLIAYAWHPASNAKDLLEYARKREGKGLIQVTALPHNDFR